MNPTAAILLPAFHEAIPVRKTDQTWIFEDESSTIRNDLFDVWSADRRNDFYADILESLTKGKTEGESQGLVWELDPDLYDSSHKENPENLEATENEIDWETRFHLLADAVDLMNETSIYNYAAGCCIPVSEAWDYLTDCAKHYAQPRKVKKLALPALPE